MKDKWAAEVAGWLALLSDRCVCVCITMYTELIAAQDTVLSAGVSRPSYMLVYLVTRGVTVSTSAVLVCLQC